MNAEGSSHCPYGLACRFYGTHKDDGSVVANGNGLEAKKGVSEVNGLNKDVQKLLWKNKMKFPKADSVLKSLKLLVTNRRLTSSLLLLNFASFFFFG